MARTIRTLGEASTEREATELAERTRHPVRFTAPFLGTAYPAPRGPSGPLLRPYCVQMVDLRKHAYGPPDAPRFPLSDRLEGHSFAETTEADALAAVRRVAAIALKRAECIGVAIELRELVHRCARCDGFGSRKGRDGRYRQCRACSGEPFRYERSRFFVATAQANASEPVAFQEIDTRGVFSTRQ